MTTFSAETLEHIRSLQRITTAIGVVFDRRRNQVRGMVRSVLMAVFGQIELNKAQELGEILINPLSSNGDFSDFRLNHFR